MLAGAIAAFDLNIPIAHIHGGDAAQSGHQDEIIRPILSLLSDLHFPASQRSKERLILLGVDQKTIHLSGSPALDAVRAHTFGSEKKVQEILGVTNRYAIVLFHPHDAATNEGDKHIRTIFAALEDNRERELVIIYPNNDAGHERIIAEIKKLSRKKGVHIFKNMPQSLFLDALRYAEFLI